MDSEEAVFPAERLRQRELPLRERSYLAQI